MNAGAARAERLLLVVAAGTYAVCAVAGLLSVFWRRFGWVTDHAGNVAVCGFVMAAAWPGAWLQRLGQRHRSTMLVRVGKAVLPLTASICGVFFVAMEIWPLYAPNTRDLADIPASVIGTSCGAVLGCHFESVLVRGSAAPARARASGRSPR